MSVSFSDLTQKGVGDFAKLTTPSARSQRSLTHLKPSPSVVVRQLSENPMTKYRGSTTHVCGKPTHKCVSASRVWKFLKDRHPVHTDKNTAQELSAATGENISYRTVERWRRRLPSGRHIILLFITFPDLIRHLSEPADKRQAEYDALVERHNKLQAQGTMEHGKRERWDENEDSCGG